MRLHAPKQISIPCKELKLYIYHISLALSLSRVPPTLQGKYSELAGVGGGGGSLEQIIFKWLIKQFISKLTSCPFQTVNSRWSEMCVVHNQTQKQIIFTQMCRSITDLMTYYF